MSRSKTLFVIYALSVNRDILYLNSHLHQNSVVFIFKAVIENMHAECERLKSLQCVG